MRKLIWLWLVCLLFILAYAADKPTPQAVFEKMKKVNPGLNDYSAQLKVKVKIQLSILPLPLNLEGKYYYKKPDKHKLELKKAPKILQKYPQIFGWNLPDINKNKVDLQVVTLEGGKPGYHMNLYPIEGRGDITFEEIWVDQATSLITRYLTHYKGDGKIDVNIKYRQEKGFYIYDAMTADFAFPKVGVTANAQAAYGAYQFNIGLKDDFFQETK